jgi:hypothetical protein
MEAESTKRPVRRGNRQRQFSRIVSVCRRRFIMTAVSRPIVYLICFAICTGMLLGPVAHAKPITAGIGGGLPVPMACLPVSTFHSSDNVNKAMTKGILITAGIGAGIGLITYAAKKRIDKRTPWTAKGAVCAMAGGAGGLLIGAFLGLTLADKYNDAVGKDDAHDFFSMLIGGGIGALVGGIGGAILAGNGGDKWASSTGTASAPGGSSASSSRPRVGGAAGRILDLGD